MKDINKIVREGSDERYIKYLALTCKNVLLHPRDFFKNMSKDSDLKKPLVYAFIMMTLGSLFSVLYTYIFSAGNNAVFFLCVNFFKTILKILLSFLISSVIIYISVLIINRSNSYWIILRILSYASSSNLLFAVPPLIFGSIAGLSWNLLILFIGIKIVFVMSNLKTIFVLICSAILAYCFFMPMIPFFRW